MPWCKYVVSWFCMYYIKQKQTIIYLHAKTEVYFINATKYKKLYNNY